jgi:Mrp family chromosome partitioning ATPase
MEPENKPVLDVLAMRERRLDAALAKEANAIDKLTEFCVADKSAAQAQSAAVAAAFSPPSGVGVATTTTTVPSTTLGASSTKIMKRKLPESVDGWKD